MAAVTVVGVALAIASIALIVLTQRTGDNNVRDATRLRARDFVALLESGTRPDQLHIRVQEDTFVQVIGPGSQVLASSPTLEGKPPVADIGAGESQVVDQVSGEEGDPFMVVGAGATTSSGQFLVLVARNVEAVRDTAHTVAEIMFIAFPLLLIVVGITTWLIVGRALAPVETIRTAAKEISATELHKRVPNPSGDDEVARLARTVNEMLARLDESQAEQQRFVSDASHELRNPIAAIRQHVETALAHPDQTPVSELAGDVLAENSRLQQVAEDLLLLARIDESAGRAHFQPIDLDDLVFEEADRLRQSSELQVDTSAVSAARTRGDRAQLGRLIRNLVDNAGQHARSQVSLSMREINGEVSLQVDDDGTGIPEDNRVSIFERFSRLDEGRARNRGGAGLGLAIVAGIAAAHGGSARVDDSPLGGARFVVLLPRSSS